MMSNNLLKSNSGFSMVQVVLAAGIAGMLAVVALQIAENAARAAKEFRLRENLRNTSLGIVNLLTGPRCLTALGGLTFDGTSISAGASISAIGPFDADTDVNLFPPTNKFIDGTVQLRSINVLNPSFVNTTKSEGMLEVEMRFSLPTSTTFDINNPVLPEHIRIAPIFVKIDTNTGLVKECTGLRSVPYATMCEEMLKGEWSAGECRNVKFYGNIYTENNLVAGQAP